MAIQNEIIKVVAQVELDDRGRAEAAEGLKKLNDECADLRKEIEKTEVEMTKLAAAGKKDSQEFKDLGKHLNQTKDQLKANTKLANQHARALGLNHMTYNQLKAHASKLRKELNSLHKETEPEKWKQYNEELVATEKRMKEVKGGMEDCGDGLARLQSILGKHKGLLSVLGLTGKVLSSVFKQMTEQTQVWGDWWQMTTTKINAGWNQFIANIGQGKDVIKASIADAVQAAAEAQLLYDELFERENSLKIISVKTQTEINNLMAEVKDSTLPESVRLEKIDLIIEKERYLAGLKKDIAQQELDAAAKALNVRTGLDDKGLQAAIDDYEINRPKFKLAEEYLALCDDVNRLLKESNIAGEQAYLSPEHKKIAEEALSAYTAALKRKAELDTEETRHYAEILKQYNLANDEMVNKYVTARLKMLEADEILAADGAKLSEKTSSLKRLMRDADADAAEQAYNDDIDTAEKAYRTELNSLKRQLLDKVISQEEYNNRSAELERTRLENLKEINLRYGKDISVIDGQILDERLKNQVPQKKDRPTTDLSVSGGLATKLPSKATSKSDPGIAKTFDMEMTALNLLHEAKAISEEEYLKRRNELYEKYGIEQEKKDKTLWEQGAKGKLQATMMMLDAMDQAVSAAKDAEMASLDAQMQAELAAAGDNAEKREQIEAEYEAKKLDLQKKYADVDMGIQIAQSIASGAMAMIQAWNAAGGNPVLAGVIMALIGATTAAQIATIVAQRNAIKNAAPGGGTGGSTGTTTVRQVNGFSEGGYTGDGGRLEVAGVVHRGEYVVPQPELRDPYVASMVATIESRRRRRTSANALPGFAEGGYTGLVSGGGRQTEDLLTEILGAIRSNNENPVPAYVVLSDLNAQQETMARHKASISLRRKSRD